MTDTPHLPGRPNLDAESFQRLLAAAYVLQEHNDRIRKAALAEAQAARTSAPEVKPADSPVPELAQEPPRPEAAAAPAMDYTQTLAEIVATQQRIQTDELNFEKSLQIIADRTRFITHAQGAAIGLVEDGHLVYRAAAGTAAALAGSHSAPDSSPSAECLATGNTVRVDDTAFEPHLYAEMCRVYKIRSFAAVPIYYQGAVVGAIEVHLPVPNALDEHAVRACQLMAGLVSESRARAEEQKWKQSLAAEREAMLAALQQLKPQLERLASTPAAAEASHAMAEPAAAAPTVPALMCRRCGVPIKPDQRFCGLCGTENSGLPSDLPSKESQAAPLATQPETTVAEPPEHPSAAGTMVEAAAGESLPSSGSGEESLLIDQGSAFTSVPSRVPLMTAVGMVVVVCLIGAALWLTSSGGRAAGASATYVSLKDRIMIKLGLEKAPTALYRGNPYTEVWVDLHAATYYCPGAALYGNTGYGKFTTQRNAQLEQFEAVDHKPCD